jgi:hypothetical protein
LWWNYCSRNPGGCFFHTLVVSNLTSAVIAVHIFCSILIFINFVFVALQIIPPGVEFGHMIQDFDMDGEEDSPSPASEDPPIWSEVANFSSEVHINFSILTYYTYYFKFILHF